jgi:hypothetical protein
LTEILSESDNESNVESDVEFSESDIEFSESDVELSESDAELGESDVELGESDSDLFVLNLEHPSNQKYKRKLEDEDDDREENQKREPLSSIANRILRSSAKKVKKLN